MSDEKELKCDICGKTEGLFYKRCCSDCWMKRAVKAEKELAKYHKKDKPLLTSYIEAAMLNAEMERISSSECEYGEYYGTLPDCPGVWACELTPSDCSNTLRSVLGEMLSEVNNNIIIGKRFRSIRNKCGLTLQQIADYLEVDRGYISKCESGCQPFSVDIIERASNLFGCYIEHFMDDGMKYTPMFTFNEDTSIDDLNMVAHINLIYFNLIHKFSKE